MATQWNLAGNLKGPQGDPGPVGDDGVSITDAEVNGSGDLILDLSSGGQINAGRVKGADGGGIDFESSVQSVGNLPASAPYGEARYVRDNGHLYVFERAADRTEAVDGWTDVGPIRGETGASGADGAPGTNGVSVTGAAIDGAGRLILTLSNSSTIDAGVARGAKGDTGNTGTAGSNGTNGATIVFYTTTPPSAAPYPVNSIAFDPATGDVLRAV